MYLSPVIHRITTGDHEIRQLLEVTYGITEPLKVQELDKEKRNEILLAALDLGAGLRQLSRLTGVTYGVIHRLSCMRQTDQGTVL